MLFTHGAHNIPQTGMKSWHGANQKAWLHRNPVFFYCLKDYYLHKILWAARNAYGYRNFNRFRNRILHIFSLKSVNRPKQATAWRYRLSLYFIHFHFSVYPNYWQTAFNKRSFCRIRSPTMCTFYECLRLQYKPVFKNTLYMNHKLFS